MIPTLFIGRKRADIIYWEICDSSDCWLEYMPEICSYELLESYQNVADVLKTYYKLPIPNIKLTANSLHLIQSARLYLSGDSMGLAWLIGLLCFVNGKTFPEDLFAWGAIKPSRKGGYSLFPTSNTRRKVFLAEEKGKNKIILHRAERSFKYFSGEALRLQADLTENLKILETMINAY